MRRGCALWVLSTWALGADSLDVAARTFTAEYAEYAEVSRGFLLLGMPSKLSDALVSCCRYLILPEGSVSEELLISAPEAEAQTTQPDELPSSSRSSDLIPKILDVFSSSFFCLPFSTVTYMLGCWWNRFLAEE